MAVTKDQPIAGAPRETRLTLGRLLYERRKELGYGDSRPRFYNATGINKRYADDLENGRRDNFGETWLEKAARGYAVTLESILDVAWGRADALTPVVSANPADAYAAPATGPAGLPSGEERSLRRYIAEIVQRLADLAAPAEHHPAGIRPQDATGKQLFPREGEESDAAYWDQLTADLWPLGERIWMVAEVQRQSDLRKRKDRERAS